MRTQLDDHKRAAIVADYSAGILSVRQIADKHDVSIATPTYLAQEAEAVLRTSADWVHVIPKPPELPITSPAAFRRGRECLGMSAAQCGKALGVSQRTVRSWEQDPKATTWSRRPNPAALKLLEIMIRERYDR